MTLFKLTLKSILSRKLITGLLVVSIALSSMLLIGVQKIKRSAKESFSHSISDTDLIIGTRSGDVQLLLYSVFRQGQAVANISWKSIESIKDFSEVAWLVPFSLGDSHKGYAVMGTSADYFIHYKYGYKQQLAFKKGRPFNDAFEVVLGSHVAKKLGYNLGDTLHMSHGMGKGNLHTHDHAHFKVSGILKPTGTPVDKTVHISLEGMEAMHSDNHGALSIPESVTGCFVGLTSKFSLFTVQRRITNWPSEPLMAIIPGVSLARLWSSIRTVDTAFLVITVLVTLITFMGLLLALFMSLQQRGRELSILRTMGAHPSQLFLVLMLESLLITLSGVLIGILLMFTVGQILQPVLEERLGLILHLSTLSTTEFYLATAIILFGLITSIIPAILAYKKGLSEGFMSL